MALALAPTNPPPRARVVIAHDPEATSAFEPRPERIRALMDRALIAWTRRESASSAWRSLVSNSDVVGIKVYSAPGPVSGTRPSVVAAAVEGLLEAGLPPANIIVWDEQRADLRRAGFYELQSRYGIRVEGGAAAGYDEATFYETALLGQLVWGDLEFGRRGEKVGRRSFVSKLVAQQITKLISISPLLNHNSAGVAGHLYSLGMGSVDNTHRFEMDAARLAQAVPEVFALPSLSDHGVLHVTDALICQYQGEQRMLLHYASALNQLRVSTDPVALDVLSIQELNRQRTIAGMTTVTNRFELYENATLLELGVNETNRIDIERAGP